MANAQTGGIRRRAMATGWLVVADAAAIVVSYALALYLRFLGPPPMYNLRAVVHTVPVVAVCGLLLAQIYGLYEGRPMSWPEQVQSIFVLVLLEALAATSVAFVARSFAVPRSVIAIAAVLNLLLMYGYRGLAHRAWSARHGLPNLVLVCPAEPRGDPGPSAGASFRITATLRLEDPPRDPVLAAAAAVRAAGADGLLLSQDLAGGIKEGLALYAVEHGLELFIVPRLLDLMVLQSRPSMFGDRLVINLTGAAGAGYQRALKRFIDVCLSAGFLVLTAPLMGAMAIAVLMDDGPPVLYRQVRIGRHGRHFTVTKVRTMVRGAEAGTGPVLARPDDPRMTRVGRLLRRLHLDELPQLWNVLRGEMSLVGPRPERPELHEAVVAAEPHFAHRLHVLPGVTGLAQVQGGYDTHPQEKLKFDTLYSLRASAALDAQILLRTVRNVLASLSSRPRPPGNVR
jgi:exopolysaccharide biosynthesis polyprenyl glycosylphosphotransferase